VSGVVVNILTRLGIIGAAKGDTTARQATVSEIDANHNALDVSVKGTPALAADAATATLQGTGNASLATLADIVSAGRALVTEARRGRRMVIGCGAGQRRGEDSTSAAPASGIRRRTGGRERR